MVNTTISAPFGWRSRISLLATLVSLAFLGCRMTDLPIWDSSAPSPAGAFEVETVRDVSYYDGPGAVRRHRLDLFLPKGCTNYPVVVLVHGGAWVCGDNRCCGLYS